MSADGSNLTRLTHDPSHDWNPIWSDGCTGGPEFDPEHLDYHRSNCLAEGNVFANVYGDRAFIRDVLRGLQVGPYRSRAAASDRPRPHE